MHRQLAGRRLDDAWFAFPDLLTHGVTVGQARARLLEARFRRRWRFAVFEREGLPCHACGTAIERVMVASRRLYLCPRCQPAA